MTVLDQRLTFNPSIREVLAWIGVTAQAGGFDEAGPLCARLASQFDEGRTVDVEVPIVHILCQIADRMRTEDEPEAVAQVEAIVAILKRGEPRKIIASLGFNVAHVGQLDDRYEALRKKLVP